MTLFRFCRIVAEDISSRFPIPCSHVSDVLQAFIGNDGMGGNWKLEQEGTGREWKWTEQDETGCPFWKGLIDSFDFTQRFFLFQVRNVII